MHKFGMLIEDPFYDEDGVLVDEDADWEDIEQELNQLESYSPHDTINS